MDPEDVFISFRITDHPVGEEQDSSNPLEDRTWLQKFNLTSWGIDRFEIYEIEAYTVWTSQSGGTRLLDGYVYEFVSDTDAGNLIGTITETIDNEDGARWISALDEDNPVEYDQMIFFAGVWGEAGTGTVNIYYETTTYTPYTINIARNGDPFTDASGMLTRAHNLRLSLNCYKSDLTTHNQYYGTETEFVARRDVDPTFVSGASERQIQITYPALENVLNISYNDGDWDQSLGADDFTAESYNATHNVITLPEATISTKGTAYRIFTEPFDYQYTFYGLYYENGTTAGAVNVSAYCPSETEIFELNGTAERGFEEQPVQFSWGLPGGVYRKIYVYNDTETHYIYTPDGDYSVYPFYVKDYCGYLGIGDCFLEALRIVDGEERLIERIKIQDSITSTPLILTHYKIYILQVRTPYDIYRFGYYTPEVDSTWTLRLKGISFSQNIAMSSKDVIMEGTRPNATHIKGTFLDEKDETTLVKFEVWYRSNYTVAYSDNSTSNPVQFNWYNAHNETDYIAHFEITHPRLPSLERNFPLSGDQGSFSSAPSLGVLGTWGPLDAALILPVMILLIVGSLTDERNAEFGAFIMWCIAAGMSFLGWYPNSGAKLVVALIFIFIMGLGKRRGR